MAVPSPIATSTIVAQAFRYMEKSPISSFGDDSDEARAAAEQYPTALRMVLEIGDWSFASVLREIPEKNLPASATPDPELPHVYAVPPEALILREVEHGRARWRRDRDFLRVDQGGKVMLRYTADITDETRLPAQVKNVVALQLAVLLAPIYLTTQTKRSQLAEMLREAVVQALRGDAQTASPAGWSATSGQGGDWVRWATS